MSYHIDLRPLTPPTDEELLLECARRGHVQGIQRALDAGAPIDCRNQCGFTPRIVAAHYDQLEAVVPYEFLQVFSAT